MSTLFMCILATIILIVPNIRASLLKIFKENHSSILEQQLRQTPRDHRSLIHRFLGPCFHKCGNCHISDVEPTTTITLTTRQTDQWCNTCVIENPQQHGQCNSCYQWTTVVQEEIFAVCGECKAYMPWIDGNGGSYCAYCAERGTLEIHFCYGCNQYFCGDCIQNVVHFRHRSCQQWRKSLFQNKGVQLVGMTCLACCAYMILIIATR